MFHQEYIWSNKTQLQHELRDIERAGFKALFLTVDNTGINGIRTRALRFTGDEADTGHSATFDLQSLAALRNMTKLPIVPKGIKTWQDAALCASLGFPAIYISNHGGRVLDGAPTAAEVLLAIRKNAPDVFDKVEVYADGGVRRGTDVIKLLALGARAVGVGRPWYFANVFGQPGVARAIEQLRTELGTSMQLMGEADVDRVVGNASYVRARRPPVGASPGAS
jgi:isopentenyl diphosphate isomerase/L-lactate dehydrogenase-like FMN-dependent dehydrogenase